MAKTVHNRVKKANHKVNTKFRLFKKMAFSRIGLIVFISLFAALGAYITIRSSAVPPPPTVYLTTPASFMPINTNFSVQVRENSGTTPVNAVQAYISYPASLLSLVSISTTGSAFGTEAQNTGGSGTINIARGTSCSTTCSTLTGDQFVVTLNFKTLTTGGAANVAFTAGTALVSASTNSDILGGLSATAGFTVNVDTTAPTVSVTAPASGATISAPGTTTISASATDADRVSSVDIYIDGTKATTLTTSPYNYNWNTTGVSLGNHTIQAKATDPSGNLGSSTTFTVTLADQTAPTASLTAPAAGSILRGTVNFTASASDNTGGTGISKVEFYVDGVLKATDTTSPYSAAWDTTTATNAAHSLTAKAYDGASTPNNITSSAVSVTTDNSAPTAPTNFRSTGNALNSISLAWNASTDNVGVSNYRLTRNGTTLVTLPGTTLTYNDANLAPTTTYSYTVVALDAAGNTSSTATLSAATQNAKTGDLNGDNAINITDLSILLSNWNTSNGVADINADGTVNIFDLSILLSHFGT